MNEIFPASFSPSDIERALMMAKHHDVIPDIHPDDFIFNFMDNQMERENAISCYFNSGNSSLKSLNAIIADRLFLTQPYTFLEFAPGYGCVSRFLSKIIPVENITCCDIHPQANEFLNKKLGIRTYQSQDKPADFAAPRHDIVFALSFFTHMPRSTWTKWFHALGNCVKSNGYLIFTTHGFRSAYHTWSQWPVFDSFEPDGFWFAPHSEQHDLDLATYGTTATLPSFVFEVIRKSPFKFVTFTEGVWFGHQDVYVLQRED